MHDSQRRRFIRRLGAAFGTIAVTSCGGGKGDPSTATIAAAPPAPAPVPAPPAPAPPAPAPVPTPPAPPPPPPAPAPAGGPIIPGARRTDWTPGVTVGVIGGIPTRNTVFLNIVTALGADPTGAVDASAIINNALANCPEGQVVYVPPGTYRVDSRMAYQTGKNKVLRGAGPGLTVFRPGTPFGGSVFHVGVSDFDPTPRTVSAGATKDSTTIEVADTADVAVGEIVQIFARNPPLYIHGEVNTPSPLPSPAPLGSAGGTLGWMFRVTAKTATTIDFWPPLPMDIAALAPAVGVYNAYGAAGTIVGWGFEDFSIDASGSDMPCGIAFRQAWGCWIRNVEIRNFSHQAFGISSSLNCEFRRNYLHTGAQGSGSEGFDLISLDSWNLIEDNIVHDGGGIVLNDAGGNCGGNVVAYNFIYGHRVTSAALQTADLDLGHGTQDTFNLVEGNVIGCLMGGDGYYGGASHNTIFRNWLTATNPWGYLDGRRCMMLKSYNVYFNIVGNVLGTSDFPTVNNAPVSYPNPAHGGWYEVTLNSYSGGNQAGGLGPVQTIYELGYPNIGNTFFAGEIAATDPPDYSAESPFNTVGQKYDHNVAATASRHGNYDYFTRTQVWETTNRNVGDFTNRTLPASLLYATRPAWFVDKNAAPMAWPPIDPAAPKGAFNAAVAAATLPAASRFYGLGS